MNLDYEGSRQEFLELLGKLDDPAFVRRARHVEDVERVLLAHCQSARNRLLEFPQMRIGRLAASIDLQWDVLAAIVGEETTTYLSALHDEWSPELKIAVTPTNNQKKIRQNVKELAISFEYFNKHWLEFLDGLSFDGINQARDDYNRYYVIEKACAFQSDRIGQIGFKELAPYNKDEIFVHLPLLKIPELT